jgi:apolipoprotein N-acyltransferase
VVAVALLVSFVGAGLSLRTVEWVTPIGKVLRVAIIQGNISQQKKWRRDLLAENLAVYVNSSRPHFGADLMLWPETAVPAFADDVSDFLRGLDADAASHGTALLVGLPIKEAPTYYNAVLAFGTARGRYDKRHLVPFGEFLPIAWLFGPLVHLLKIPMSDFAAGEHGQAPILAAGVRIGLSICFEDAFAELVREALPAADVLVNVSDDAWFGDSLAPPQHLVIAQLRAKEMGRYLLRGTNNGISAVIGPDGAIRARTPQFIATTLQGQFQAMQGTTPFARWGTRPVNALLVVLLGLSAIVWGRRRHRAAPP